MLKKSLRSNLIASIFVFIALCTSTFGKTIYVDDDATGANDGSSWEDAYVYLQDALADANESEKPVEIWVAQGIYTPDSNSVDPNGNGNREATFQLINGVTLKGSYAGLGESDPNVRDISRYNTILCGDLADNDVQVVDPCDLENEPSHAENSCHVVTGSGTDGSAVLDGFTITAGNANASNHHGAGMYIESGSPMLYSCTFNRNFANGVGGGLYNTNGNLTLYSCAFIINRAYSGGGIYNTASDSNIVNCTFKYNSAVYDGGGLYNSAAIEGYKSKWYSDANIINCIFSQNSAGQNGGGMYNTSVRKSGSIYEIHTEAKFINCAFSDNFAGQYGGGLHVYFGFPIITESVFKSNTAGSAGGGIGIEQSSPDIENCVFSNNSVVDGYGGGIWAYQYCTSTIRNCTFVENRAIHGQAVAWQEWILARSPQTPKYGISITNCILWDNGREVVNYSGSIIGITNCDIKRGLEGIDIQFDTLLLAEGNVDFDPLFANLGYWADVNDPNIAIEPNDPNAMWVDGDYHLKSEAGRWDPVSESWVIDDVTSPCIDAGDPNSPVGDEPEPNGGIINMGAYSGTAEASKSPADAEQIVYVQWLGHSTVKVWTEDCVVYVDPERVPESLHDATLVCVTHTHGDHYSPSDIAKVSNAQTQFIAPPDVVQRYGSGQTITPGQTIEFDFVSIKAVPSYNINKSNHPKSNNWVGYIIELAGKRVYVAGDTDLIEEMKTLGDIDVAFLPAGGTYTMNATEAAEATGYIKPDLAIPYHWGQNTGTIADAQRFAELAQCPAMVLTIGETISSDNWPEYSPLIAHWALDESEGDIAHDSAGDNHIALFGEPAWQPDDGKIGGALQFDGINDYGITDFVLDPANGPFSVFAWIKSDAVGQVIIDQFDGTGSGEMWLGTDPVLGKLMTGLVPPPAGRFITQPLASESIVTDGQWHHIGFIWDGSYRSLYVDGTEVAKDSAIQNPLKSADGDMYIGAGKALDNGTFFSGLIDEVRVYSVALTTDEIEELMQ